MGPISNPARLEENDDILTMFNKIVACGNADVVVRNNLDLNKDDLICIPPRLRQILICDQPLGFCLVSTRVLPTSRKARYSLPSARFFFISLRILFIDLFTAIFLGDSPGSLGAQLLKMVSSISAVPF